MSDGNPFHVLGPTDASEEFMDNVDLQKIGLETSTGWTELAFCCTFGCDYIT